MLALALAAGCKTGPVVIDGTIIGYDGREVNAKITKEMTMENVDVAEDGTFHLESMIDEIMPGGLSIVKGGSYYGLIIPGKHYKFTVDLGSTPAAWTCETDCQAEQDFYRYMTDTLLRLDYSKYVFPEKFVDYDAMWNERVNGCEQKLKAIKSRTSSRYFKEAIRSRVAYNKINYASQMEKRGLRPEDDPDYMAYFNSIDLNDEKLMHSLLGLMLAFKSKMYPDTIPPSVRYVNAVNELAKSEYVRDSVTLKHVDIAIKDGRLTSESEAEFLLETADRLVDDPEKMEYYRSCIAKTLSLMPGRDAIDFPMKDTKGTTFHLSDFKGKVVYIDFWATWCIPCCIQTPYMAKVAEKYAKNPEVACISVSIDENFDSWKGRLAYEKPSWYQFIAEDTGKQIMEDYGFRGIPRFMIFDQEGRIVNVNAPRPQEMDEVCAIIDSLLK